VPLVGLARGFEAVVVCGAAGEFLEHLFALGAWVKEFEADFAGEHAAAADPADAAEDGEGAFDGFEGDDEDFAGVGHFVAGLDPHAGGTEVENVAYGALDAVADDAAMAALFGTFFVAQIREIDVLIPCETHSYPLYRRGFVPPSYHMGVR